jgi:UDP-N-acetylglucosamine 2-epimerase (non-hydrolysing)
MPLKVLFVFGTRPEAIKLAPLIIEFKAHPELFSVSVCVTAQHREMLDSVLDFFSIKPDFDLNLMKPNQSLAELSATCLLELDSVLKKNPVDLILVQGDTTTVLMGAMAGYLNKIKVAHVEAGLRSGQKYSPFPEEINRKLVGQMADYHFAPTAGAKNNLLRDGTPENSIWVVGNTVIDALFLGLELIDKKQNKNYYSRFSNLDLNKKIILVTSHRRESFGVPFENICAAIREISLLYPDVQIVFPVHLNPNIKEPAYRILDNVSNILLTEPLNYDELIWILSRSYMVLTDSGGIQEEAPSLGKPVLVMRDVTERTEGVAVGTAILVGSDKERIIEEVSRILNDEVLYERIAMISNPYGDGTTSKQILQIIKEK